MLPTKFQVNWPFDSGEVKNNFQDGHHSGHLGFLTGTILATFDLQVTPMLGLNWPFGFEEEAKTRFSSWHPWRSSWIGTILTIFDL